MTMHHNTILVRIYNRFAVLVSALLTAFLLFFCGCALADNDMVLRDQAQLKIIYAWQSEDFVVLEQLAKEYMNPASRTPSGKRLLAVFEQTLEACITNASNQQSLILAIRDKIDRGSSSEDMYGPEPSKYPKVFEEWAQIEKRIDRWAEKYPVSPTPYIAKAMYYQNLGWYFRGHGLAKVVRQEAWPIFRENMAKALNVLTSTKEISKKNPIWYSLALGILGTQSPSRVKIDALVSDALENGQGYANALQAAFHFKQPMWGGSYQDMTTFAKVANSESLGAEHGGTYARLYWNYVSSQTTELNMQFYARTNADWKLISESFDMIIKDYPEPRNLNAYALFSCMANDIVRAKNLLRRAETTVYFKAIAPPTFNVCLP